MTGDAHVADVPPGKLRVVVTYLEMRAPPAYVAEPDGPPEPGLRIAPSATMDVPAYRRLYDGIGEAWLWGDRRRLDDAALAVVLGAPGTGFLTLLAGDVPAGLAEFVAGAGEVKLAYFGLMPAFTGRRLGPWFLRGFVRHAWSLAPERVWLHTCTLDHPAALRTYEAAGFTQYRRASEIQDDPRALGLIPADAAPHVPYRPPDDMPGTA